MAVRRTRVVAIVAAVALAMGVAPLTTPAAAAPTATATGASLHGPEFAAPTVAVRPAATPVVVGNRLVDSRTGLPFVPRGVNWPSFVYACYQGWGYSAPFGVNNEAAEMASWHINSVRLPLNQDCWLGVQGAPAGTDWSTGAPRTATGYRAAVREWVDELNAAGIVVILDLHANAPIGHPAHGLHAVPDSQSVTFWQQVAAEYAGSPSVMFDLFNEPYSRWDNASWSWAFELTWECWKSGGCQAPVEDENTEPLSGATYTAVGMDELVAAVRSSGARQPILLAGISYSNDLTGWLAHRPNDSQLVASWHNYPFQPCDTVSCWNAQVAPVAAAVPVVATEFGQTDGGSDFLVTFMKWADAHGVGYQPWAWWDVTTAESVPNSRFALYTGDHYTPKPPAGTAFHDHLASLGRGVLFPRQCHTFDPSSKPLLRPHPIGPCPGSPPAGGSQPQPVAPVTAGGDTAHEGAGGTQGATGTIAEPVTPPRAGSRLLAARAV